MSLCIGLDIGATRTKAVLISTEAGAIAFAEVGPGNPATTNIEAVKKNLAKVVDEVIEGATGTLECVGIGSAGAIGDIKEFLQQLYVSFFLRYGVKPERIYLFEDIVSAHISAFLFDDGIVFIMGTGSNCYGVYRGKSVRIGGWGYLLGDEGSGFWIAREGINAALKAYDGRGRKTALLDKLLAFFGVDKVEKILLSIYGSNNPTALIASFAPKVFEAAKEGDEVANEIIRRAVSEIGEHIETAIRTLGAERIRIALIGGVWDAEKEYLAPLLKEELARRLGWEPDIESAKVRPECASALYAMRETGILTEEVIKKVLDTCKV